MYFFCIAGWFPYEQQMCLFEPWFRIEGGIKCANPDTSFPPASLSLTGEVEIQHKPQVLFVAHTPRQLRHLSTPICEMETRVTHIQRARRLVLRDTVQRKLG